MSSDNLFPYIPDIENNPICEKCGKCCLQINDGNPCCDLVFLDGKYRCGNYKERYEICRKYPYPHLDRESGFCPLADSLLKNILDASHTSASHTSAGAQQQHIEQVIRELEEGVRLSERCWDDDGEAHSDLRRVCKKAIALLQAGDQHE